jgi:hypothetical protein
VDRRAFLSTFAGGLLAAPLAAEAPGVVVFGGESGQIADLRNLPRPSDMLRARRSSSRNATELRMAAYTYLPNTVDPRGPKGY